mmetsp:Transcript_27874/g.86403  ORF Transcript_27874/g.86403 Transcript_27874/m.86403 type:complete len:223 (+) Transcript_27874:149-817(+)
MAASESSSITLRPATATSVTLRCPPPLRPSTALGEWSAVESRRSGLALDTFLSDDERMRTFSAPMTLALRERRTDGWPEPSETRGWLVGDVRTLAAGVGWALPVPVLTSSGSSPCVDACDTTSRTEATRLIAGVPGSEPSNTNWPNSSASACASWVPATATYTARRGSPCLSVVPMSASVKKRSVACSATRASAVRWHTSTFWARPCGSSAPARSWASPNTS